jgi:multicomponent K+:H+ antiporter subunit E
VTPLRRALPAPALSAALLVLWLVLARSASPGQVLLGAAIAVAVPHAVGRLRYAPVRLRHPLTILRYASMVALDVLRSNIGIARGTLRWRWRRPVSRFVVVPLDLRDPLGLAMLSVVTTIVPGTVWSELALDRSAMLLHVWDAPDEATFVARFKARYERPLLEIFE